MFRVMIRVLPFLITNVVSLRFAAEKDSADSSGPAHGSTPPIPDHIKRLSVAHDDSFESELLEVHGEATGELDHSRPFISPLVVDQFDLAMVPGSPLAPIEEPGTPKPTLRTLTFVSPTKPESLDEQAISSEEASSGSSSDSDSSSDSSSDSDSSSSSSEEDELSPVRMAYGAKGEHEDLGDLGFDFSSNDDDENDLWGGEADTGVRDGSVDSSFGDGSVDSSFGDEREVPTGELSFEFAQGLTAEFLNDLHNQPDNGRDRDVAKTKRKANKKKPTDDCNTASKAIKIDGEDLTIPTGCVPNGSNFKEEMENHGWSTVKEKKWDEEKNKFVEADFERSGAYGVVNRYEHETGKTLATKFVEYLDKSEITKKDVSGEGISDAEIAEMEKIVLSEEQIQAKIKEDANQERKGYDFMKGVHFKHCAAFYGEMEKEGEGVVFVMEDMTGGELQDYIHEIFPKNVAGEPLPPVDSKLNTKTLKEILQFSADIVAGIGAMHAENVAHLDIKDENVMLKVDPESSNGKDKYAVMIDFGSVAKLKESPNGSSVYSEYTTDFLALDRTDWAPEVFAASKVSGIGGSAEEKEKLGEERKVHMETLKNVDLKKVDMWVVAVLLFQLFTGKGLLQVILDSRMEVLDFNREYPNAQIRTALQDANTEKRIEKRVKGALKKVWSAESEVGLLWNILKPLLKFNPVERSSAEALRAKISEAIAHLHVSKIAHRFVAGKNYLKKAAVRKKAAAAKRAAKAKKQRTRKEKNNDENATSNGISNALHKMNTEVGTAQGLAA